MKTERLETQGLGEAEGAAGAPASPSCLQVTTQSGPRLSGVDFDSDYNPETGLKWSEEFKAAVNVLTGSARRSAYALQRDAERIVDSWGCNNTVFITKTFGGGGKGPSVKEAEARFNSYRTNVLCKLFPGGIKVLERGAQKGRVHFHLLADAGEDVRTGVDFKAMARDDRSSFGTRLKELTATLKKEGQKHGFGRIVECDPIKSTTEGVARYCCKYISKHFEKREERDKGARLRSYWGDAKEKRVVRSCQFGWVGEKSWLWRAKLAKLSKVNDVPYLVWSDESGKPAPKDCEWNRRFGPRWAHHLQKYVLMMPLTSYPKWQYAEADGRFVPEDVGPDDVLEYKVHVVQREVALFGKVLRYMEEGDVSENPIQTEFQKRVARAIVERDSEMESRQRPIYSEESGPSVVVWSDDSSECVHSSG